MYYVKLKSPFSLKWGITLAGSSLDLADATLRVLLKNARGSIDITDYITDISNNVIKAAIPGLNYLGEYSLQLRVESASTPTFELNERYALKVVDKLDVEGPIEVVINSTIRINDGKELDEVISTTSANAVQNKAIGKKFEEERNLTNSQIESAVSELDAYINDRISSVQAEIDNNYNALMAVLNNKYEEFNREISGRLAIFTDETNERLNSSDQEMKEFRDTLNNSFITFKGELSNSLAAYKGELYNLFASFQESIEGDYNDFKNGTINTVADFKGYITARVDEFENTINSQFREFKITLNNSFGSFVEEAQAGYLEFQNEFRVTYAEFTNDINSSLESFKSNINSTLSSYQSSLNQTINDRLSQQDSAIREIASANESFREEQAGIMEEFQSKVSDEVAKKVSYDGKYPQLTSGFASNLVGRGEATGTEFSFRASGGKSIEDGTARIAELRGNGVVWNQLAKKGLSPYGNNGWCLSTGETTGLQYNAEKNEYSFACDGLLRIFTKINLFANHKYYIAFDIELQTSNTHSGNYFVGYFDDPTQWLSSANNISSYVNKKQTFSTIISANSEKKRLYLGLYASGTSELNSEDTQIISKPIVYDLTLMFEAGNEPTTIEEFYARKPIGVDEYAYNEGTLIPFNADGIKSVGFNAWDEELTTGYYDESGRYITDSTFFMSKNAIKVLPNTRYFISSSKTSYINAYCAFFDAQGNFITRITNGFGYALTTPSNAHTMIFSFSISSYGATYNNDVCIHLVHTGYRNGEYQPYEDFVRAIDPRIKETFPNGMKPWDKAYNKNGKGYIVKGTGVVDMGTLNWGINNAEQGCYWTALGSLGYKGGIFNLLCSKYEIVDKYGTPPLYSWELDKVLCGDSINIIIRDTAFANYTTEQVKTAMQGVMLWYELADEYKEVIEYDEPFNLDYEVWDFGTEEILSEQPSAPISADIIYQFNAVDTIRNNQIEIAQLKAMIATMQAQMASMVSTTMEE